MSSIIGDIIIQEAAAIQLSLSNAEIAMFERYAEELKKWNTKINLTAITKDKEIAVKHFMDSLTLAQFLSAGDRLLDIGSGAGFPVIPLKIIRPDISMVSVDAVAKKIHFQRHIIRVLNLENIEVIHTRIEEIHKTYRNLFSVITSRAFTRLDHFVTLSAPLLAEGGILIAMKGDSPEGEIAAGSDIVSAAGFDVVSVHRYSLPQNMGNRVLTFLKKCKPL